MRQKILSKRALAIQKIQKSVSELAITMAQKIADRMQKPTRPLADLIRNIQDLRAAVEIDGGLSGGERSRAFQLVRQTLNQIQSAEKQLHQNRTRRIKGRYKVNFPAHAGDPFIVPQRYQTTRYSERAMKMMVPAEFKTFWQIMEASGKKIRSAMTEAAVRVPRAEKLINEVLTLTDPNRDEFAYIGTEYGRKLRRVMNYLSRSSLPFKNTICKAQIELALELLKLRRPKPARRLLQATITLLDLRAAEAKSMSRTYMEIHLPYLQRKGSETVRDISTILHIWKNIANNPTANTHLTIEEFREQMQVLKTHSFCQEPFLRLLVPAMGSLERLLNLYLQSHHSNDHDSAIGFFQANAMLFDTYIRGLETRVENAKLLFSNTPAFFQQIIQTMDQDQITFSKAVSQDFRQFCTRIISQRGIVPSSPRAQIIRAFLQLFLIIPTTDRHRKAESDNAVTNPVFKMGQDLLLIMMSTDFQKLSRSEFLPRPVRQLIGSDYKAGKPGFFFLDSVEKAAIIQAIGQHYGIHKQLYLFYQMAGISVN